MRQHEKIELFLKESCPPGLPFYRKSELKKELSSHIYDKADYFKSLGKSEEDSISEAVKAMGKPSDIRASFRKIYRFERLPAIIIFFAFAFITACSLFLGFVSFSIEGTGDYPTVIHYFISSSYIGCIAFLYLYSYRKKNVFILFSVSTVLLLSFLTFFWSIGMIQSSLVGTAIILCSVFGVPEYDYCYFSAETVAMIAGFYGSLLLIFALLVTGVVLIAVVLKKIYKPSLKPRVKKQKPLWMYFAFIASVVILSSVLFSFAADEYEFAEQNIIKDSFFGTVNPKKTAEAYNELSKNMSENECERLLRNYGFVKYEPEEEFIDNYRTDYFADDAKVYILDNSTYSYDPLYNDCYIIMRFSDKKLIYKKMCCYRENIILFAVGRVENTAECYEKYLTLKDGDSRDAVMKKISNGRAFLESAETDFITDIEICYLTSEYERPVNDYLFAFAEVTLKFSGGKLCEKNINAYGYDGTYDYEELELQNR